MVRLASLLSLLFCLCLLPVSFAAPGCCSHHGGVKGCNASNNHQLCKDGSTSPTCLCNGGTSAAPAKAKKSAAANHAETSNTPAETTAAAPAAAAASNNNAAKSTKGCCSRHGGVAKCDAASGHQMCKDGTISSACKC